MYIILHKISTFFYEYYAVFTSKNSIKNHYATEIKLDLALHQRGAWNINSTLKFRNIANQFRLYEYSLPGDLKIADLTFSPWEYSENTISQNCGESNFSPIRMKSSIYAGRYSKLRCMYQVSDKSINLLFLVDFFQIEKRDSSASPWFYNNYK